MTSLKTTTLRSLGLAVAMLCSSTAALASEAAAPVALRAVVDGVVQPLMAANAIPGMAVAVSVDGETHVFNYGVASQEDGWPVDERTLFEIGSVSKVFTGTLGAWIAARGELSLADPAERHLPALSGTPLGRISLLDLATYTAGGLPLQFPDAVRGEEAMLAFFRDWHPSYPPGSRRLYSNPSIGLFGYLAARGAGADFEALMTTALLPKLGLSNTFLHVPEHEAQRYAYGTSEGERRIRVSPGALDAQGYGLKTTAADLIRFVQLAMDPSPLDGPLSEAFAATQTGYYRFGPAMQGLGWEIYDQPASLDVLLAGNAPALALEPQPVTRIDPPQRPRPDRFVNKTGSTRGFGAYAAFLPEQRIGIVLLANRNYPNAERIKAAWAILTSLR
ncbi:class C beta-lactamase [Phytopseudomonas dryadis]|uniref:class C beta-lactamase n=1 Tax=Pseudomonadaceae TaxID=135621 RepID=UPI001A9560A8|nr:MULTISPECIES: class C beta-lactamase [Pseudomonas]